LGGGFGLSVDIKVNVDDHGGAFNPAPAVWAGVERPYGDDQWGDAKRMYKDYAFGTASLRGDQPPLVPAEGARSRPRAELLSWLTDGHRRWLAAVRALADDAELARERLTNWGERLPTRVLIQTMIAHDWYHAGEINHVRAVTQGNDHWPY
jgi:hypothetical protein